jgi:hypothetical protein
VREGGKDFEGWTCPRGIEQSRMGFESELPKGQEDREIRSVCHELWPLRGDRNLRDHGLYRRREESRVLAKTSKQTPLTLRERKQPDDLREKLWRCEV